ncbi:peptidase S28 [Hymenopellis radicata]|nr:peptidase S28 [Hymenopellis radicata]
MYSGFSFFLVFAWSLSFFYPALAHRPLRTPVAVKFTRQLSLRELDRLSTIYYFDQLVDHNDPSLGTFKQRYWFNDEWYQEGGPIVLINGGESNMEGNSDWLTNSTLDGRIAQDHNGSVILLEHRFFGLSQPFDDLSSESLKYLTIHQAIEDNVYFAQNVKLPMTNGNNSSLTPTDVPWILTGGSYPGALVSWTMTNQTDVFYAGYSSSGVVQAITDFWKYNEPARVNMPKNCSSDVVAVVAYLDDIFTGTNQTAIDQVKEYFGLANVPFTDDAAAYLDTFYMWQAMNVYGTPTATAAFYGFCDSLEVKADGSVASEAGWGLEYAIDAWASWFKNTTCPVYSDGSAACSYNTHVNVAVSEIDVSVGSTTSDDRAWAWMVCNEVGWFQTGAPKGQPSLVSSVVDVEYSFRTQCINQFPDVFTEYKEPSVDQTNAVYGSWNAKTDRIAFGTGTRDPWLHATVSGDGSNFVESPTRIVGLSDGFHCSEDSMLAGDGDESIAQVQEKVLTAMGTWLGEWTPDWNHNSAKGSNAADGAMTGRSLSAIYVVVPILLTAILTH